MERITVDWARVPNEHGDPMLWFGSWLVGADGVEGSWFYSGRGGTLDSYDVPEGTTGVRIRRWPNEGFDAEYADILDLSPGLSISAEELDFDSRQEFSRLSA